MRAEKKELDKALAKIKKDLNFEKKSLEEQKQVINKLEKEAVEKKKLNEENSFLKATAEDLKNQLDSAEANIAVKYIDYIKKTESLKKNC